MAYLGPIVIYSISIALGLIGLYVVSVILWVSFLCTITKIHFKPESFYEKYDRASVEAMSERGGW